VPKKQTTAAKKARSLQRVTGGKYTATLHSDSTLRRLVAEHIFSSPNNVLTATTEEDTLRAAGASAAADRLHAALDDAGVDLSPELDALADEAAAAAFGRFTAR
jgi:hypothetical protein